MLPSDTRDAALRLTRRQVLQLGALAGVAVTLPGRSLLALGTAAAGPVMPFLTADELAIVEAATARLIPTDTSPGAREAGVADYIQGLLSALPFVDANCDGRRGASDFTAIALRQGTSATPGCARADVNADGVVNAADLVSAEVAVFAARPIFAGGPFSGRHPFADFATGEITTIRPAPSFQNHMPLNRAQRLAWRVRLDGAASVPEVVDNPLAITQPDVDLRARYRAGLADLERISQTTFGKPFVELTPARQDQVLNQTAAFTILLTAGTIEGLLCDPEYGGNRDRLGWQLISFDGDSQPLGYTLGFDEASGTYIERADKPNSKPDPGATCAGFSPVMVAFLSTIATTDLTRPNKVFPNPFCFEVTS